MSPVDKSLLGLAFLLFSASPSCAFHMPHTIEPGWGHPRLRHPLLGATPRSAMGSSVPRLARFSLRPRNTVSMGVWLTFAPLIGLTLFAGGVDRAMGIALRGVVDAVPATVAAAQVLAGCSLLAEPRLLSSIAGFGAVLATIAGAAWGGASKEGVDLSRTFAGKVVWVTGASSGIGEALAHELHRAGARVVLSARRVGELERVRDACIAAARARAQQPEPTAPLVLPLDLSRPGDMKSKVAEAIELLGGSSVDVLVHNGGVSSRALAEEMDWEIDEQVAPSPACTPPCRLSCGECIKGTLPLSADCHRPLRVTCWKTAPRGQVLRVNFLAPVALTKALLPRMLTARRGQFVVISSVQGLIGLPARSAYASSKHALHGFFDSLRAEVASRGVGVSLICPGYVRTALSLNAVTGTGEKHGIMDTTTAKGMDPAIFAQRALAAVARRESQVVIADDISAHVAPYLRVLSPNILQWVMLKRAKNSLDPANG